MALPVTYLTTDSLAEGVGASQVRAYVERLAARDVAVSLHTFEKSAPTPELRQPLERAGIAWTPHAFGRLGPRGGVARVARGAAALRGAELVHARSDLAAASALLAGSERWLWDVRSLWAEQRIALGALREDGPEHRLLRLVEARAARHSDAVVTLTAAVIPVLERRHGGVQAKATVIPTCVDLTRFNLRPPPLGPPWRLLLAGTLNTYYDVPLMVRFVEAGLRRGRVELDLLSQQPTVWDDMLDGVVTRRGSARPEDMPARLRECHAGLSVCRADAGISLTAAMPTKIAEFLATGRPVVVSEGLGDADKLVRETRTGVVLTNASSAALARTWDELEDLLEDAGTPARCRQLAEAHFDLDRAVDQLVHIYGRLLGAA